MDKIELPPNILYLKGITMEDYKSIEDIFEQHLQESVDSKPELDSIVFNKIPKTFTSINTWPKKTNLKCWTCDFTFDTVPKFVPVYIKERTNNTNNSSCQYCYSNQIVDPTCADCKVLKALPDIEIGVLGNMCSFGCVALYINTNYHKRDVAFKLLDNLCELYRYFTGKNAHYIPPSPSKTDLVQYGGDKLDIQFRAEIKKIDESIEQKLLKK
jgi:hypothetical protein